MDLENWTAGWFQKTLSAFSQNYLREEARPRVDFSKVWELIRKIIEKYMISAIQPADLTGRNCWWCGHARKPSFGGWIILRDLKRYHTLYWFCSYNNIFYNKMKSDQNLHSSQSKTYLILLRNRGSTIYKSKFLGLLGSRREMTWVSLQTHQDYQGAINNLFN